MYDTSVPGFDYDDRPVNGNSPGLLNYLQWGGSTATGLLGALNQSRAATAPAPASATNWGLIAGIGAAVIVVLVLVMSLGRK